MLQECCPDNARIINGMDKYEFFQMGFGKGNDIRMFFSDHIFRNLSNRELAECALQTCNKYMKDCERKGITCYRATAVGDSVMIYLYKDIDFFKKLLAVAGMQGHGFAVLDKAGIIDKI